MLAILSFLSFYQLPEISDQTEGVLAFLFICFGIPILIFAILIFLIVSLRSDKKEESIKAVEKAMRTPARPVTLQTRLQKKYFVHEISVPRSDKWVPERAKYLLEQVLTHSEFNCLLRIVGDSKRVVWQVIAPVQMPQNVTEMKTAILSVYPQAQVTSYPYKPKKFTNGVLRDISAFTLATELFTPIKNVNDVDHLDPLSSLVQSMADVPEDGSFIYTIYIRGLTQRVVIDEEKKKIQRNTTRDALITVGAGTISQMAAGKNTIVTAPTLPKGTGRGGKGAYIEEEQRIFEQKLYDQMLLNCYIFIQKDGHVVPVGTDITLRTNNEDAIFQSQFSSNFNSLFSTTKNAWWGNNITSHKQALKMSALGIISGWETGKDDYGKAYNVVLGNEELALLWHLPHSEFQSPQITWASTAHPSKQLLANTEGVIIGDSLNTNDPLPVRIHPHDRETHMNIVGKTGVGKSTLMHNLIHQDIAEGKGVAVIDPHGKLVRDILRVSIPNSRMDDVVLLDIANVDYPPPLNPLSSQIEDDTYTAAEIVAILDKVEPGGKLPGQTSDTLLASLVTLRKQPQGTIRDVVRLFSDANFRYQFINQVDDVITQEFWMYFEGLSPTRRDDVVNPVFRRVRKFYGNPILHPIMCHPAPLDFEQLIKDKKIVLLSLGVDSRKVPEAQQTLVGVTVTSMIQMAAMSSIEAPTPFYLYIDEVQNFVTAPLDKILAEARKFKLRLTVANQYLDQLSGKTLKAIMGTVGATIVFQVGQDDAGVLAPYLAPEIEKSDLANMDKYYAAVKTRYLGNTQPAFSIATRPDPGDLESAEGLERERAIRQRSIENYTPMTKDEVMGWLNQRYAPRIYTTPDTSGDGQQSVDWSVQTDEDD